MKALLRGLHESGGLSVLPGAVQACVCGSSAPRRDYRAGNAGQGVSYRKGSPALRRSPAGNGYRAQGSSPPRSAAWPTARRPDSEIPPGPRTGCDPAGTPPPFPCARSLERDQTGGKAAWAAAVCGTKGGVEKEAAIVFRYGRPVAGREKLAFAAFGEALGFSGKKATDGLCQAPVPPCGTIRGRLAHHWR